MVSYVITSHFYLVKNLFLRCLLLLLSTPDAANPAASALGSSSKSFAGALRSASNTSSGALQSANGTLSVSTKWALALERAALLVLASSLSSVDALLREGIADRLSKTTFANLAADKIVDTVLEVVDLVDTSNFSLVELLCMRDESAICVEGMSSVKTHALWYS
jgi:hypothetical protein